MNILPVNNTNSSNTNFNGKILTIGKGWNSEIRNTFRFNPEITNLAKGKHDIIGRLHTKKASRYDLNHDINEPLYRLDLMFGNSKFEFINKIKAYLGLLPKFKITHDYHCKESFLNRLNKNIDSSQIKNKLEA